MTNYFRYDEAQPVALTRSKETLRGVGRIARIGVQTYSDGVTEWVEFRPPEEVIKMAELCDGLPITLNHPSEFVDGENFRLLSRGTVLSAEYKDGWVEASLSVVDRTAVDAAQSTHTEFSQGYACYVDWTPGTWVDTDGVLGTPQAEYQYDAIQRNILPNHEALVTEARAGHNAKLIRKDSDSNYTHERGIAMAKRADSAKTAELKTDESAKIDTAVGTESVTEEVIDATDKADSNDQLLEAFTGKLDSMIELIQTLDSRIAQVEDKAKAPAAEEEATEEEDSEDMSEDMKSEDKGDSNTQLMDAISALTQTVSSLQQTMDAANKANVRSEFFNEIDAVSSKADSQKSNPLADWANKKDFNTRLKEMSR